MKNFNKAPISLLLGMSIITYSVQSFSNDNVANFINELPQEIDRFTPEAMEEIGNPYEQEIMRLSANYTYQQSAWPINAAMVASKYIRFNVCKEKAGHYIDFTKDINKAKEFGKPFTFKDIIGLNNGFYYVSMPFTDLQRAHPIKGPIQLAFEQGWKDQGVYKIKDYFNACISTPLSGYMNGFKQHGFYVGAYINL